MEQEVQEERLFGLFATMAKGDIREQQVLPHCILLIGLTRVGKSTVFNWLAGHMIMGKREKGKAKYEEVPDMKGAEVSDRPISKTLISNIEHLPDGGCLIDPAGFQDRRNHVGVFTVNYMLKLIFEKGQSFQFLIVIPRSKVDDGGDVLETLYEFVNLFDYENLQAETRQKLLASTAMVITKADSPEEDDNMIEQLKGLAEGWSMEDFSHDRKEACIEVLNAVTASERIGFFRTAKKDQLAPKTDLLETLKSEKGWGKFDLGAIRQNEPGVVVNSFAKDYHRLIDADKDKYESIIEEKIGSFKQVCQMLGIVIETTVREFYKSAIDFGPVFEKIREFLNSFDEYTPETK